MRTAFIEEAAFLFVEIYFIPFVTQELFGMLRVCACAASSEKHAGANQITEVVPSPRIGKRVDSDISKKATDKTEHNKETMK